LLGLLLDHEERGDVSPERRSNFYGLHGVINQITAKIIAATAGTSNPTFSGVANKFVKLIYTVRHDTLVLRVAGKRISYLLTELSPS
jgi:hypothetical protein